METTQEATSECLIEEDDDSFGESSTSVGTAVAEQSEAGTPVFEVRHFGPVAVQRF